MDTEFIQKDRRKKDRRVRDAPYHGPERRSGKDRRMLDNRLKQLIEEKEKNQAIVEKIKSQSGAGTVIRRRDNGNKRVGGERESE